ncbi:leucine-rich repeat-containing protein 51-like [Haliotis rubra]|uniref:leucine-rich repeat-containing protein 51-like n=1 Tax=Haliotis rubra TaxID=36100 RepID=UPI001EE59708|nr:leucine-rich repeat-containing protein 51-like [Haliotis rubra]
MLKMSGTSVVPYSPRQKKATTLAAIDTSNDSVPPLDFSFYKLASVQDVYDEEPRAVTCKKGESSPRVSKENKSKAQCLRLNNNQLSDIKLLLEVTESLFTNPGALGWIDLSFNDLTVIDPVLTEFENLEILYLHGNNIAKIQEVDKLQSLRSLRKLTLHGNPVEEFKGYKQYILSLMPWLLGLDFFRITKADLKTAETWNKMSNKGKPKKKSDAED